VTRSRTITTDGKVTRFRVTRFGVTPLGDSPGESAPRMIANDPYTDTPPSPGGVVRSRNAGLVTPGLPAGVVEWATHSRRPVTPNDPTPSIQKPSQLRCLVCGKVVECGLADLLRLMNTHWPLCCGQVMPLFPPGSEPLKG
jgi:hypothetical protein